MSVETLLKLRDAIQMAADALNEELEKHAPPEVKPAVSEKNFNLNYSEFTSQKLGTFEIAENKGNITEKWNRAFNILKNANATISSRYHNEGYGFSYWLYNNRIYRQKLER